jgi:hypothetical protein
MLLKPVPRELLLLLKVLETGGKLLSQMENQLSKKSESETDTTAAVTD